MKIGRFVSLRAFVKKVKGVHRNEEIIFKIQKNCCVPAL